MKIHNLTCSVVLMAALVMLGPVPKALANGGVLPSGAHAFGKSYTQWNVAWWQWALGLPVAGHPFNDTPGFDVSDGQSGQVWFLATPTPGTAVVRNCAIPAGKALFIESLNSEWSSLEGFATEADQRAAADWYAQHMHNVYFILDGRPLPNIGAYLVSSPQFTFTAPSPWIFGATGGTGTTVAEGYCFLVAPLSVGQHTIRYGGWFHFSTADGDPFDYNAPVDMTYNLTVVPDAESEDAD